MNTVIQFAVIVAMCALIGSGIAVRLMYGAKEAGQRLDAVCMVLVIPVACMFGLLLLGYALGCLIKYFNA